MSPTTDISAKPDEQPVLPATNTLTEQQQADLSDATTQERYRREYLQQQRRQSCPGCGEGDAIY